MLQEPIEPAWLDAFESVLGRCALQRRRHGRRAERKPEPARAARAGPAGRRAARRRRSSPSVLPSALQRRACRWRAPPAPRRRCSRSRPSCPRSRRSTLVVDCTVEGLMHAPELPAILKGGARVLYVSNEHPEALARLLPDDALEPLVKEHVKRLRSARADARHLGGRHRPRRSRWRAPSAAATGATPRGPGTMTHWPGGLALAFPAADSVNGTLVLAEGDVNLTFKRYLERRSRCASRTTTSRASRARASTPI